MTRFLVLLLIVLMISPFVRSARADQAADTYTASLLQLNRTKPSQNPNYALGKEILNRRLIDKNLKTLGKVSDITLSLAGIYQSISSVIDTAGFRQEVSFDVTSYIVDPTRGTFTVAMDKQQIVANMPKLMASIETASGEGAPLTLNTLRAGEIRRADGYTVAKIQDVMVDDNYNQVVALLVSLAGGNKRGSTIAIPYSAASMKREGNKAILTVTDKQADIMTSMATRR